MPSRPQICMVTVFICLFFFSIARIIQTLVDQNQITTNKRLELLQLFAGENHSADVPIVTNMTLFEVIDNAQPHKDSGIKKLQQDDFDAVVVKKKTTIQLIDNAKSQTRSASLVTGNTMSKIILAIAVHTSRLDRYIAVKGVLSLQKESHLCQNGNIVLLRPFFFRDQCHDCPQELHQLTKKNAFHRSVEMLLSASNAAKADFVFKMDDDTFLNTAALSRRVCALQQQKKHYQGFLMYAGRLFASGGAGYLVSSSILENNKIHTCKEHQYEDVGLAHCLWAIAGISPTHLDVNPDTPEQMLVWSKKPSSDHRSKATFHDAVSFHYISAERQVMMLPQKKLFPRRIHQIWLGNGTPPWSKLQTCRELHPDWEITLWTAEKIKNIRYDSKYQDRGSFISKLAAHDLFERGSILKNVDLLKVELLYRFGGFAMDADQICIRRLDPLLAIGLNSDYAAGHEHNHAHSNKKSLIANGVQISHQYSPTVFQLLLKIPTLRSGGPAWKTTGPCLVSQGIAYACGRNPKLLKETNVLCSKYFGSALHCSEHDVTNITLLSSDVFFPYHHSEKHKMASCSYDLSQSFTVQYWSSTSGGYKKEMPENNIKLKIWRLDEKSAFYYGSWAPGPCLDGIRGHPIARSKDSGVQYRLTPAIPTGSRITLSSEANVDLGRGFSRWKNMQVVDPISSIHVLGTSPVIKVHLPAEYKYQIKITYDTSITPNQDGSNVLAYTQPRETKIIYHHLIGRCGNQLFQTASILGIAARNSASVCMSGNEISKYFEGTPPSCSTTKPKSLKKISENRQYATFHDFKLSNDVELTGYFQSYRYFSRDVRSQVKIKKSIINLAQKTLYMFQSKTLVGIHMRRFETKRAYLRIPPNQYFINAKKFFTEKYIDVQFVVTCDDTEWCMNQSFLLQDNVYIVKKNNEPVVDMAILAACHHIILSVGTFGWWAAFLGPDAKGGTVVYYDSVFVMEHEVNNGNVVLSDFYPPNWIALSSNLVQTNLQSFASVIQNGEKSLDSFFTTTENNWCPGKYTDGGKFITQLYKNTASHGSMTCKNIKRIGNLGDGGKFVCMDTMYQNECVVYSLGSRLDFTFELDIIQKLKCNVYTFDCTVGDDYASKIPSGVFFYPWCVGAEDAIKTISSDFGHTGEKAQYYTIGTIMKKLQHKHIDLLKMDIERHEFAVVKSLDSIHAPNQIVFETHVHNAYGVWGRAITQAEWDELWAKLYSFGYLVFSHEQNPLCLCCCEFSLSRRLETKHNGSDVTSAPTSHYSDSKTTGRLFLDGYATNTEYRIFAKLLFPEMQQVDYEHVHGSMTTKEDILFIGIGPEKGDVGNFMGKKLFIEGEAAYPRNLHLVGNNYYLGPLESPHQNCQQFFYAQFAAAVAGSKRLTNPIRRTGHADRFLLYRSGKCRSHREKAFHQICTHAQQVVGANCYASKCFGGYKKATVNPLPGYWIDNTKQIPYRFELAMDRVNLAGYVSEKILNSFLSGTVPIYYGTTDVFKMFNKNAFIYYDINNPQPALDRILYLEKNRTAYAEVLSEPILADGALETYFSLSDDVAGGLLKRRIRSMLFDSNVRLANVKEIDAKTYVAGRPFPPKQDRRDQILQQHVFSPCLKDNGLLVGGKDTRPNPVEPGEPKFVCDVNHLGKKRHCIVYSFGSWNEIMFEVGIKALAPQCEVHTFDPFKLPAQDSVRMFNFSVHPWGIGNKDSQNMHTLDSIMRKFGHAHVDVLKLDVEGAEVRFLDWLFDRAHLMSKIGQLQIEFHRVETLEKYCAMLIQHGFRIVHARVNDLSRRCTEVAFQNSKLA